MLKKAFKWFGFIIIAKQVFTFQLPFFSIPFLGRDVNTYLYYLFILLSLLALISFLLGRERKDKNNWFLLFYLIWSLIISIFNLINYNYFLSDFALFVTPIAIYSWYKYCHPSLKECINWFSIVGILMAYFSIMISTGSLDVGIWAAEGDYVRAAGAISSSAGIGCLIGILSYLFFSREKRGFAEYLLNIVGLAGSVVTIIFSFSRTRWVISIFAVALVILAFLFTSRRKKNKFGFAFLILLIGAGTFLLLRSNILDKAIEQMMTRFDLVQYGDHSIIYRQEEMYAQLNAAVDGSLLGTGWGSISGSDMYVHNIFTALVMQAGLFSIFYLLWYFSFFATLFKYLKVRRNMFVLSVSTLLQLILIVLGITNGGFMVSGGYFTFVLVVACDVNMKKELPEKKKKGVTRVYENRHINLSPSR